MDDTGWFSHLADQSHEDEVDEDNEDFYGYGGNNGDVKSGTMDIVCLVVTEGQW